MIDALEITAEIGKWRSREMKFVSGRFDRVLEHIPLFEMADFKADDKSPANPLIKTIVRMPQTELERPMAVGTVSPSYVLLQHRELASLCHRAIKESGLPVDGMKCEVGLSKFGELMVFRMYLPEEYNYKASEKDELALRVECINSVDGSYRLVVLFGWLRFVCLNGMVIGKTLTEIREIHSGEMDLKKVVRGIREGLEIAKRDKDTLAAWTEVEVDDDALIDWVDEDVLKHWGVKAAFRAFHISRTGYDVQLADPFAEGKPTQKPVKFLDEVPGAPKPAKTLFDVMHSLTWISSQRPNFEERVEWQSEVPTLINLLGARCAG